MHIENSIFQPIKKGINLNLCYNIVNIKILTKEIYAMSTIAQNSNDEVALIDHIKKFFAKYQLGKLLKNVTAQRKKVFRQSLF